MVKVKTKFVTDIAKLDEVKPAEMEKLREVCDVFDFRATDYYLSLIDWDDPDDPIRRLIVPHTDELQEGGALDASNEKSYTAQPGLQHKYDSTALLLVSNTCASQCRYCFRKRIFITEENPTVEDLSGALNYIREHDEITNVLLTGGDPLMLPTQHLHDVVEKLRDIDHVKVIRIGTKMLSFNPYRVTDDPALIDMVKKFSKHNKKMYFVTHFSHVNELTDVAEKAVALLQDAGAAIVNQTPLITGVNDDADTLAELLDRVSFMGVAPYYVFQCRPAVGNKGYAVPIERGLEIFETARSKVSGLAKRARYVMSHSSGKIEILGMDDKNIYMKYHRSAKPEDDHRFLVCKREKDGAWLDDFEVINHHSVTMQSGDAEPCTED